MTIPAKNVEEYLAAVPEDKKEAFLKLFRSVSQNIPSGFSVVLQYGMPSFVVPLSDYPSGYHVKKDTPLPFISLAAQKNFIALYHMGLYTQEDLMQWFINEYPKHSKYKLDMGKSCIRFKHLNDIPLELIEELVSKMKANEWIKLYEKTLK